MTEVSFSAVEEQRALIAGMDRTIAALMRQRAGAARRLGELRTAMGWPRSELAWENEALRRYRVELGPLGVRLGLLLLEMVRDSSDVRPDLPAHGKDLAVSRSSRGGRMEQEVDAALGLRQARVSDHRMIVGRVQQWWSDSRTPDQARELSLLLPRLFLQFFSGTSLVLEDDADIRAFLIGFYAADNDEEAYIHFVGVDPTLRGQGLARRLYTEFLRRAAGAGRREVRAITSPGNTGSIAFHQAMGFTLEPGDREVDGLPVCVDYDGPGQDRVCFYRKIVPDRVCLPVVR
ncbi:GNAT family N-acetyltransferase [Streptomyces malaysiensis]|uniref:GNAT family N-acetyltransferase n=1 Tax=Streptomyces malaysiensis TaxID=92644 RepID=UPI00371E0300